MGIIKFLKWNLELLHFSARPASPCRLKDSPFQSPTFVNVTRSLPTASVLAAWGTTSQSSKRSRSRLPFTKAIHTLENTNQDITDDMELRSTKAMATEVSKTKMETVPHLHHLHHHLHQRQSPTQIRVRLPSQIRNGTFSSFRWCAPITATNAAALFALTSRRRWGWRSRRKLSNQS